VFAAFRRLARDIDQEIRGKARGNVSVDDPD